MNKFDLYTKDDSVLHIFMKQLTNDNKLVEAQKLKEIWDQIIPTLLEGINSKTSRAIPTYMVLKGSYIRLQHERIIMSNPSQQGQYGYASYIKFCEKISDNVYNEIVIYDIKVHPSVDLVVKNG